MSRLGARVSTAGIWTWPTTAGPFGLKPPEPDNQSNGTLSSTPGAIRVNAWQHVAVVVKREQPVSGERTKRESTSTATWSASGAIGPANLDNPKRISIWGASALPRHFSANWMKCVSIAGPSTKPRFKDWCSRESSLCNRLPPKAARTRRQQQVVTLTLGDRQFSGTSQQPAFLAVRLEAGPLQIGAQTTGCQGPGPHRLDSARRRDTNFRSVFSRSRSDRRESACIWACAAIAAAPSHRSARRKRWPAKSSRVTCSKGRIRNFPSSRCREGQRQLPGRRSRNRRPQRIHRRPRHAAAADPLGGVRRPVLRRVAAAAHRNIFVDFDRKNDLPAYARKMIRDFRHPRVPPSDHRRGRSRADGGVPEVVRRGTQLSSRASRTRCWSC